MEPAYSRYHLPSKCPSWFCPESEPDCGDGGGNGGSQSRTIFQPLPDGVPNGSPEARTWPHQQNSLLLMASGPSGEGFSAGALVGFPESSREKTWSWLWPGH